MKKIIIALLAGTTAAVSFAEGPVEQFNALGYGTLSGRLQTLSMYRDFENHPSGEESAYSTTLGVKLDYRSPEMEGWQLGASYIGAGVLDANDYDDQSNPGETLLGNGRVNILNEAFLSYNMKALGLTNTTAYVGRIVNNGEVFRADDVRQKPRAFEAAQITSADLEDTRITVGHAWEMSNWIIAGDRWKFENFDNLMARDGVTWGELVNSCVDDLEVAVYDAIAYDIANLFGLRGKYSLSESTALLGYYRWEHDVGDNSGHDANVFGISLEQKMDGITLEGGYFGVYGDDLFFEETTVGINHALGSSMIIAPSHFWGGTDTLYAKAVTKIESTGTVLYGLYNYTLHDEDRNNLRQAQELNIVIKQPVPKIDNLTIAFKSGIATRDGVNGDSDTTRSDNRIFLTYTF